MRLRNLLVYLCLVPLQLELVNRLALFPELHQLVLLLLLENLLALLGSLFHPVVKPLSLHRAASFLVLAKLGRVGWVIAFHHVWGALVSGLRFAAAVTLLSSRLFFCFCLIDEELLGVAL